MIGILVVVMSQLRLTNCMLAVELIEGTLNRCASYNIEMNESKFRSGCLLNRSPKGCTLDIYVVHRFIVTVDRLALKHNKGICDQFSIWNSNAQNKARIILAVQPGSGLPPKPSSLNALCTCCLCTKRSPRSELDLENRLVSHFLPYAKPIASGKGNQECPVKITN